MSMFVYNTLRQLIAKTIIHEKCDTHMHAKILQTKTTETLG